LVFHVLKLPSLAGREHPSGNYKIGSSNGERGKGERVSEREREGEKE
jgi:hypothetical protein